MHVVRRSEPSTPSDPSHRGAGILAGAPRCLQDEAMSRTLLVALLGFAAAACASNHSVGPPPPDTTGQGAFLDDLTFPDMLYAAVLRSPHAHARITALDTAEALQAEGVVCVLTGPEIRGKVRPMVLDQEAAPPGLETAEPEIHPATIEILADGEVRHVGQAVAAVVADSRYRAEDAAELVRVDYEELPAAIDPQKRDNPIVFENVPGNVQARYRIRVGDADAALAGAAHRLALNVRSQRVTAAPMETRGVLASTVGEEWESNRFIRVWRGLDPEGSEPCTALGEPATLVLLAEDYDGGTKAWVRWSDGSDDIVPGSRVEKTP